MPSDRAENDRAPAAKKVLDVGQCGTDHWSVRRLIEGSFAAKVLAADDARAALDELRHAPFDLVLVNRRLDSDGSDGLEIVRAIKADPQLAAVPVMLVTNFPEYQNQAIAAGAVPGFGKAELHQPHVRELLAKYLR